MSAVGTMSSTGGEPEVVGQGQEPGEGGKAVGMGRDPSGTESKVVPHSGQREVLGGNWAPSFTRVTNVNEDLLVL